MPVTNRFREKKNLQYWNVTLGTLTKVFLSFYIGNAFQPNSMMDVRSTGAREHFEAGGSALDWDSRVKGSDS
jgi:hypothetical protein